MGHPNENGNTEITLLCEKKEDCVCSYSGRKKFASAWDIQIPPYACDSVEAH